MYCKNCDIKYDTPITECLLCKNDLLYDSNKVSNNNFPIYKRKKNIFLLFYKLLVFINILSVIITLYIDYSINNNFSWSLIVSVSNIYFIFILSVIKMRAKWLTKIILLIFLTSIEVLSIGFIIKDYFWAIDYVLPFSLLANLLVLTFIYIFNRKKAFDYISYLVLSSIISIIPLLLTIFNITKVKWPSLVTSFYGLAIILGLIFFTPKQLKEEFLRKFHI